MRNAFTLIELMIVIVIIAAIAAIAIPNLLESARHLARGRRPLQPCVRACCPARSSSRPARTATWMATASAPSPWTASSAARPIPTTA